MANELKGKIGSRRTYTSSNPYERSKDAQRIPFPMEFIDTILQFKVPSSSPTSKEARYDYPTTLSPMARKSPKNAFALAATKRRAEKKFKTAVMCCRRKLKAQLFESNKTPVTSSLSKKIMKTFDVIDPPLSAYRKKFGVKKNRRILDIMATLPLSSYYKRRPKPSIASFLFGGYSKTPFKFSFPATPQQTFPSSSAAHVSTPKCSSLPTKNPINCSDIAPQTTSLTSSLYNPANTSTVLPSSTRKPPEPFNIFGQSTNTFPGLSKSPSSRITPSTGPLEWPGTSQAPKSWTRPFLKSPRETYTYSTSIATTPGHFMFGQSTNTSTASSQSPCSNSPFKFSFHATPQQKFPSSSAAHVPTPKCSSIQTKNPINCSDIAPQTTSCTNSLFHSANTSTVLPSATRKPPGLFNIFSQSTNPFPGVFQCLSSSSTFQSRITPSTAPLEWPGTSQTPKSWTRPFLKSPRETYKYSASIAPTPGHFMFGQSTNTSAALSQSPCSNSPFKFSFPATPQQKFPSSSAAHVPTPKCSSLKTKNPINCSDIAPQTTSCTNSLFHSANTSTVLPSATRKPPGLFNIFSQSTNPFPGVFQCLSSSSTFQSRITPSTAPLEWPGTSQTPKSWTRPFLKSPRETYKYSASIAPTPGHFMFGQSTNTSAALSQSPCSNSPFKFSFPATPQQKFPSSSAAHVPTPKCSSLKKKNPINCSDIAPQTTSCTNSLFHSANTSTVLPSATRKPPGLFNIFSQSTNPFPGVFQCLSSSSTFQSRITPSTAPLEWPGTSQTPKSWTRPFLKSPRETYKYSASIAPTPGHFMFGQSTNTSAALSQSPCSNSPFKLSFPATPQQKFPSSSAAHVPTPKCSSLKKKNPINCSDIAPQTTSCTNSLFHSANTSTVLPSATRKPPGLFNIFSQSTNPFPGVFQCLSSSSTFQSRITPSTAPLEWPGTSQTPKSWTRPFLKSPRETYKYSASIAPTPGHFMFGQSTNTSAALSQSPCSNSPFKFSFPATPQQKFPSSSAAHVPTPKCSSLKTKTPMEWPRTPQPSKSWTSPFLKSPSKTDTFPTSAANTPQGHLIFGQSTNTTPALSKSPISSPQPFKFSFPRNNSPATPQQQTFPSSSVEHVPPPKCSSLPTKTPPVFPSNMNPFAASQQSRDVTKSQKTTITIVPKKKVSSKNPVQ